MEQPDGAAVEDGDLSDLDIHRVTEALKSRRSKTVAKAALSIKSLLTEIQQQLLELLNHEDDYGSVSASSSSIDDDDDNDVDYVPAKYTEPKEEEEDDSAMMSLSVLDAVDGTLSSDAASAQAAVAPEVLTSASVPIMSKIKRRRFFPKLCSKCGESFETKTALARHMLTHTDPSAQPEVRAPTPDENGESKAPSLDEGLVNELMETVTDDGLKMKIRLNKKAPPRKRGKRGMAPEKLSCKECGIQTLKQHMNRHMMKHTGLKPFQCTTCGDRFARKDKLKEHEKRHDATGPSSSRSSNGPKQYNCRKCSFTTMEQDVYRAHMKQHPSKNVYRCDECDKEFSCPSHLEQHNIKHRNEKPYMCDMCGVSFSREPNLARHIRSHVNPAPFKCKFCQKPYHRQNEMLIHERTHTGEKPYICEICGNGYAASKYLKRHIFTHTGLKPHKCDLCDRAFARPENMRAHRKIHEKSLGSVGKTPDAVSTAFHESQRMDTSSIGRDNNMPSNVDMYSFPSQSAAMLGLNLVNEERSQAQPPPLISYDNKLE